MSRVLRFTAGFLFAIGMAGAIAGHAQPAGYARFEKVVFGALGVGLAAVLMGKR